MPRPVLLGRDFGNLLELAIRKQEAYTVLTRIQKKKKEKEEATALTKEITSGVQPRKLLESDQEEREEDDQTILHQLDDSIFEGEPKPRKTKRERRQAKKVWQSAHSRTVVSQQDGTTTNNTDPLTDDKRDESIATTDEEDKQKDPDGIDSQEHCSSTILNITKQEFQNLQETDPTLEPIRRVITEEVPQRNTGIFFKREGILYRLWSSKDADQENRRTIEQLILPTKCRKLALEVAQDISMGGHLGRKKTLDRLLARFYWPGIIHDVSQHCKSCGTCQKSAGPRNIKQTHLVLLSIIGEPFQRIAMDIVGPLIRSKSGNKYILVICDYSTRYPEAVPLKNIEAETIAEELRKFFP